MDIVLAVFSFLFVAGTSYLGVHVTLHPAETPRAKLFYKIAFALGTLLAAIAIGWQAWLGRVSQSGLQRQLEKIQHNTEQPPIVNVAPPIINNIPSGRSEHTAIAWANMVPNSPVPQPGPLLPFSTDKQPQINMGFHNAGDFSVISAKAQGALLLVPHTRQQTEVYKKYIKSILSSESQVSGTLVPHEQGGWYHTYNGPKLSDQDIADLNVGAKILCGIAVVTWTDKTGTYRTSFNECCVHESNGGFNWHTSVETNHEEKLK
jgi:hypothetical protein